MGPHTTQGLLKPMIFGGDSTIQSCTWMATCGNLQNLEGLKKGKIKGSVIHGLGFSTSDWIFLCLMLHC